MENSKKLKLPPKKYIYSRKDLLYNDLINILEQSSLGWTGGTHESIGNNLVNRLVDLLWYIDPHHEKLKNRGYKIPDFFLALPQYQNETSYNQSYFTSHHKKEQLKSNNLQYFVKAIESCISQPWASIDIWGNFIGSIFDLCHSLREYIKYLNSVNSQMNANHSENDLIRNVIDNIAIETRESQKIIDKKFNEISYLLECSDNYELHFLDNHLPESANNRFNFIKEMTLRVSFTLYRYYHGNYLGTLNFIWKIPEDLLVRDKSFESQMIALANEMIPKFFTRKMKKNIAEKVLFT
jgi:hypothetical protein